MPSATSLFFLAVDNGLTAFSGNERYRLEVIFYNTSGGGATIATALGLTFVNNASPVAIAAGTSVRWDIVFDSPTTAFVFT